MTRTPSECTRTHPFTLQQLGWTNEHAEAFAKYHGQYLPGRVACRQKTVLDVLTEDGPVQAGISGALKKLARFPAVGDFVVLFNPPESGSPVIVDILPRKTAFVRSIAGQPGTSQVIAANVDTVFIVTAAGPDLNASRIERYLTLPHASGFQPVIPIN